MLEDIIQRLRPTIILLQESRRLDDTFKADMARAGFKSIVCPRDSDPSSGGVAVIYDATLFKPDVAPPVADCSGNMESIVLPLVHVASGISIKIGNLYSPPDSAARPIEPTATASKFKAMVEADCHYIFGDLNARQSSWEPYHPRGPSPLSARLPRFASPPRRHREGLVGPGPQRPDVPRSLQPRCLCGARCHRWTLASVALRIQPSRSPRCPCYGSPPGWSPHASRCVEAPVRPSSTTVRLCLVGSPSPVPVAPQSVVLVGEAPGYVEHLSPRPARSVSQRGDQKGHPTRLEPRTFAHFAAATTAVDYRQRAFEFMSSGDPGDVAIAQRLFHRAREILSDGIEKLANTPLGVHRTMRAMSLPASIPSTLYHGREKWDSRAKQLSGFASLYASKHAPTDGRTPPRLSAAVDHLLRNVDCTGIPRISRNEIIGSLWCSQLGKALDPEGFLVEHLRHAPQEFIDRLVELFNQVLFTGIVPKQWLESVVAPLYKDGKDPLQATSYRPVALTSIICRTFERIVLWRTMKTIALSHSQFGFRSSTSTEVPLSMVVLFIADAFRTASQSRRGSTSMNQNSVVALSIDFTDAFCRVSKESVATKFIGMGGHEIYARFIYNWMSNRTLRARVDGYLSDPVAIILGAPQGSILGPFIWLIEVDELIGILSAKLTECVPLETSVDYNASSRANFDGGSTRPRQPFMQAQFADDGIMLVATANPLSMIAALRPVVDRLGRWAIEHDIPISPKSKIHILTRNSDAIITAAEIGAKFGGNNAIRCAGVVVEVTTQPMKFLGLWFDGRLSWTHHAQQLEAKVAVRLRHIAQASLVLFPANARMVFDTYIEPLITYGLSVLWFRAGDPAKETIQRIRIAAARSIVQAHPSAASRNVLDAAGLPSLDAMAAEKGAILAEKIMARPPTCPARTLWELGDPAVSDHFHKALPPELPRSRCSCR